MYTVDNVPQPDRLPARVPELRGLSCGVRQFAIQRLAVGHTSTHELGSRWHRQLGIDLLGKRSPKVWMMPAKVVTGAVAVLPYRCAQLHYFDVELLAGHKIEVIIRHAVNPTRRRRCRQNHATCGPMDFRSAIRFWHASADAVEGMCERRVPPQETDRTDRTAPVALTAGSADRAYGTSKGGTGRGHSRWIDASPE